MATTMEGSLGIQKEHYGLRKLIVRIKTRIFYSIFLGIHTTDVVSLAKREAVQQTLAV